jgi:alpha-tubulin suppressor-like RCC1 family protein
MTSSIKRAIVAATALAAVPAGPAAAEVVHWGAFTTASPTGVSEPALQIVSGNYVLLPNGRVMAFGANEAGQLGNGTKIESETPVEVKLPPGVKIKAIGAARRTGYAISTTGQGYAWGENGEGDLCIGNNKLQRTPVAVPGITNAVAVMGGETHVLWLMANGTVEGCGNNKQGQLGLGERVALESTPVEVPGITEAVEVASGERHSLVRTANGKVYGFGDNQHGQVCVGSRSKQIAVPTEINLPGPASDISAGGDLPGNGHSMILVGGVPYGCGDNASGQLGLGTMSSQTARQNSPVVASELLPLGLTQVVALGEATVALSSTGEVYTLGSGEGFALGNGGEESSLAPLPVDSEAVEISGGGRNVIDRHE